MLILEAVSPWKGFMATIGIMDSGVGGLSVFREIRKALPREKYIYFSDNAYCPYGEKTHEFIAKRCREIVSTMVSKGASAVVLACNTATAAAAEGLRKEFDIPLIGIEPAVKPAALATESGVVGVLATAGTLGGAKYRKLKEEWSSRARITEAVGEGFVELVERGELSGEKAERTVRKSILPLLEAGADSIALGCTHYPFLLDTLRKVCEEEGHGGIRFFDPAPAVARRLMDVMKQKGIPRSDPHPGVELLSSGPDDALRRTFALL